MSTCARLKSCYFSGWLCSPTSSPSAQHDLCLAPKKVSEIRDCLERLCASPRCGTGVDGTTPSSPLRLLVLTGPPGSGKSTALRVLAKELNIHVLEWLNPVGRVWHEDSRDAVYESRMEGFRSFLLRANRYASLDVEDSRRKLILIEDFPFVADDERRTQYYDALRAAVQTGRYGLALVVSGAESAAAELRAAVPSDLREARTTAVVSVPAVSPTALERALRRVAAAAGASTRCCAEVAREHPGDVRAAVIALQLRSRVGARQPGHPQRGSAGSGSGSGSASQRSDAEAEAGTGDDGGGGDGATRDGALEIGHAVSRVLHALVPSKRKEREGRPPPSAGVLAVLGDAERLVSRTDHAPAQFGQWLQENAVDRFTRIDDYAAAGDALSLTDLLHARCWAEREAGPGSALGTVLACMAVTVPNRAPAAARFSAMRPPGSHAATARATDFGAAVREVVAEAAACTPAALFRMGARETLCELVPAACLVTLQPHPIVALRTVVHGTRLACNASETAAVLAEDDIEDF